MMFAEYKMQELCKKTRKDPSNQNVFRPGNVTGKRSESEDMPHETEEQKNHPKMDQYSADFQYHLFDGLRIPGG